MVISIEVTESDGSGSQTRHKVNMDKEYYEKISPGIIGPEDFVKKSFEFLLRERVKIPYCSNLTSNR
jgi:hypothetical protein